MPNYRLVELQPRWLTYQGRHGVGLSFECPHCTGTDQCVRIAVYFTNPLFGQEPVPATETPSYRWHRFGDTFETLTLRPSIDASGGVRPDWHGNITDGEMVGGIQIGRTP